MPFYEIIYETGNHSVASYSDDTECLIAVSGQHDRAVNGESGGPTGAPAERVVKVIKYSDHPANYIPSEDDVRNAVNTALGAETISTESVSEAMMDAYSPMVDSGPHESNYKMADIGEVTGWS